MTSNQGPIIDMTPAGEFPEAATPSIGMILLRLGLFTLALGFAAIVFWLALFTIPILIVSGLIGYAVLRYRFRNTPMGYAPAFVRRYRR